MREHAADFLLDLTAQIEEGHKNIVVDLEEVAFVDSTGLGAMLNIHRKLIDDGGIVFVNLHPPVKAVFFESIIRTVKQ